MVVPLVFTVGLSLASSGIAVAQTSVPVAPGQTTFSALDQNKDGSISRIEATSHQELSAQFTLMDQNQNGALEPAEFARFETLGAEESPGTPGSSPTPPPPPPGMSGTIRNPPPNTVPPSGATPPPSGTSPTPDGSTPPPSPR